MVAGLGVALEPPHTCRRLLGEVELHAIHLGDQAAGAPGMVEACAYGMRSAEAREWVRGTQERLGVGSVRLPPRRDHARGARPVARCRGPLPRPRTGRPGEATHGAREADGQGPGRQTHGAWAVPWPAPCVV